MMQIIDCDQGSPEWFAARLGIPTASEFATVMRTKGRGEGGESKERRTYLLKLAGEILTGEPMENYTNGHMERGKAQEDEARDLYSLMVSVDPQRVGFIRNGDKGSSPDSLIGERGGLEIKTALPHIQIDRLERDTLPPEHKAQVQGNLWVTGREWWDFVSFCPDMPEHLRLYIFRVQRDEAYIKTLEVEVRGFIAEANTRYAVLMGHDLKVAA